jgi:hypothetical protein
MRTTPKVDAVSGPDDALVADVAGRLTELIDAVDELLGSDLIAVGGPQLVGRVHERAHRFAAGLAAGDPDVARRAAAAVGRLVDVDDVDDARTPLGIAVGVTRSDPVTQAFAAAVLGVSRARVNVLANCGRLRVVETDEGGRMVTRADVAARLAERST